MPAIPKPTIRNIMVGLASCLTDEIRSTQGVEIPCRIMVVPGDAVTPDYEGDCSDDAESCGFAWVRLVSSYPAEGVGEQSTSPGNCNKTLGFTINIGIIRCWSPGSAAKGPTAAYVESMAFGALEDMQLMRRAIICCDTLDSDEFILGGYAPVGPLGDRIGGSWTLSGVL